MKRNLEFPKWLKESVKLGSLRLSVLEQIPSLRATLFSLSKLSALIEKEKGKTAIELLVLTVSGTTSLGSRFLNEKLHVK